MNRRAVAGRVVVAGLIVSLVVLASPPTAASECLCAGESSYIADQIDAADGVFIGRMAQLDYPDGAITLPATAPERIWYEPDTWIKGDVNLELLDVNGRRCSGPWAEVGLEVVVAFTLDGDGRAQHVGCRLPSPQALRAFVDPPAPSTGPARYLALSDVAPLMALDADGRTVATDPDPRLRLAETAVACADGTAALLIDKELVVIDLATWTEIERLQFRRLTEELFCPEPDRYLAIAGPWQQRQVYDIRSRAPVTSQLAYGSPGDVVGDTVAGIVQGPDDPHPTVRLVGADGAERVLVDPSELTDLRPIEMASVRISPSTDRVAFTLTAGAGDARRTEVMVVDAATGDVLARAEFGRRRAHVSWLSETRVLVQRTTGQATVRNSTDLEVIAELDDGRWIQHLDDDRFIGIGTNQRGQAHPGSDIASMAIGGDAPTRTTLPFSVTAIRLPVPIEIESTGSAFVQPLQIPLASARLDAGSAEVGTDGVRFGDAATSSADTPTDTEPQAAQTEDFVLVDSGGGSDGTLGWISVVVGLGLGGVGLVAWRIRSALQRTPTRDVR